MPLDFDKTTASERLKEIIRDKSFSTGEDIKLASGATSSIYFNMKPTMMDPEGATLIARLMMEELLQRQTDLVGGLEMGAVPLVSTIAPASHLMGSPIAAFFIRKQAKDHGTKSLIEGLSPGVELTGKRIFVLEDVTTTGGSSMQAVQAIRDAGGNVIGVYTIVDRQEGAFETFAAAGVPLLSLCRAEQFK